ncbi:ATP-dependent Clp protease proteolytic subunit [compost metagenome]
MEIHARELVRSKQKLVDIYAHHTGQVASKLMKTMERDLYLSSEEAKAFGLIDHVVEFRKKGSKKEEAA